MYVMMETFDLGSYGTCWIFRKCSISLYFPNIIFKKKELTCHFELGGAYYIRCAFIEDIKPCHHCGALKALCRVAAQFRLPHHCALRTSPLSLSELLSIIQWPQIFNRQKPHPKYWKTLICTFMQ